MNTIGIRPAQCVTPPPSLAIKKDVWLQRDAVKYEAPKVDHFLQVAVLVVCQHEIQRAVTWSGSEKFDTRLSLSAAGVWGLNRFGLGNRY